MRAWSETANSTTSAFALPPSRTSWERRAAVTLENASTASTIAATATTTAPTAIQPATSISTEREDHRVGRGVVRRVLLLGNRGHVDLDRRLGRELHLPQVPEHDRL